MRKKSLRLTRCDRAWIGHRYVAGLAEEQTLLPQVRTFCHCQRWRITTSTLRGWAATMGGSGLVSYDLQFPREWRLGIHERGDDRHHGQTEFHNRDHCLLQSPALATRATLKRGHLPRTVRGRSSSTRTGTTASCSTHAKPPIPGARVEGPNWPDIPFVSDASGKYDAYSFNKIINLRVADMAYGLLPEIHPVGGGGRRLDLALPPKRSAILNGNFENGLDGWSLGGSAMATVVIGFNEIHSGSTAVSLGGCGPGGKTATTTCANHHGSPGLNSFNAVVLHDSASRSCHRGPLRVMVTGSDGDPSVLALHIQTGVEGWWTHAWADLEVWGGQQVTLTFEVPPCGSDPYASIHLDEIVVGENGTRQ